MDASAFDISISGPETLKYNLEDNGYVLSVKLNVALNRRNLKCQSHFSSRGSVSNFYLFAAMAHSHSNTHRACLVIIWSILPCLANLFLAMVSTAALLGVSVTCRVSLTFHTNIYKKVIYITTLYLKSGLQLLM